jgi:hypothetical protein
VRGLDLNNNVGTGSLGHEALGIGGIIWSVVATIAQEGAARRSSMSESSTILGCCVSFLA